MARHFHEELEDLKQRLISMSRVVQFMLEHAVDALLKRNGAFAGQVFEKEKIVNQFEIEIDDQGHGLLALAQPMAVDLRLVTSILKINTDLERIGDHAINIAERVLPLLEEPAWDPGIPLAAMSTDVREILKNALDSFIRGDVELAQKVLQSDDGVDNYHDDLYALIQSLMQDDPSFVSTGMKLVRIAHDLERIGDLANNIAEDVLYLKQGKEVRHRIIQDS